MIAIASNSYAIGGALGLYHYYKTHQIYLIVPKGHRGNAQDFSHN